ncbi:MAG: hypothetical protein ACJAW3_000905 [Lentimonas sp.]|jgi:hypothetical protein
MTKLNQAKENLNQALESLEKTIAAKINQTESQENHRNQINLIQKELANLGEENEGLRSQKETNNEIGEQIKVDFAKIKEILNQN